MYGVISVTILTSGRGYPVATASMHCKIVMPCSSRVIVWMEITILFVGIHTKHVPAACYNVHKVSPESVTNKVHKFCYP